MKCLETNVVSCLHTRCIGHLKARVGNAVIAGEADVHGIQCRGDGIWGRGPTEPSNQRGARCAAITNFYIVKATADSGRKEQPIRKDKSKTCNRVHVDKSAANIRKKQTIH